MAIEEPVVLSETNNWTTTWSGLDKYVDGVEVVYTVDEEAIDDRYTKSIGSDADTTDSFDYTITNSHANEQVQVKVT